RPAAGPRRPADGARVRRAGPLPAATGGRAGGGRADRGRRRRAARDHRRARSRALRGRIAWPPHRRGLASGGAGRAGADRPAGRGGAARRPLRLGHRLAGAGAVSGGAGQERVPAAQRIEDALWRAAERALPAAALSHRALVRAVMERTRRYTSERERLDEPLGPAEEAGDLAARALFFAVTDSAKVSVPLGELFGRGLLPAGDAPLRVLDLGAGAGAMTLGAAAFLADAGRPVDLQVTAIDRDRPALALLSAAAADLGAALGGRVAVEARHGSLRDLAPAPGSADLVLCGSVLNELDEATRLLVIERALAAAGERGAVVVIEPALR